MLERIAYNRRAAVAYAHRWAFQRNPKYYDYEDIGGDCTNFASQCLYAGSGVMDFTPDFGWYYLNANDKAPAWTGVEYFYRYLTRQTPTPGPTADLVRLSQIFPGDFVQLSSRDGIYTHTAVEHIFLPKSPFSTYYGRLAPTGNSQSNFLDLTRPNGLALAAARRFSLSTWV